MKDDVDIISRLVTVGEWDSSLLGLPRDLPRDVQPYDQ